MTDTVFYQHSFELMKSDIENGKFPGAVLISGSEFSGKFTAALEIARILSCVGDRSESCSCEFCRQHRTLSNMNVLVAGPRDCMLEIIAAKDALLRGYPPLAFVRAVHKLTSRFNQILWEDVAGSSKFSPLIESIEDSLAPLSSPAFDQSKIEKACDSVVKDCQKLESSLYNSIPIDLIRGASAWLRIRSSGAKKVFVIENADRMMDAPRNALLKILEEPPLDAVFILTTSKRGAMMQTILSRVRTYSFAERSGEQQSALKYYDAVRSGQIPSVDSVVKSCASFEPRMLFKSFLSGIVESCVDFSKSSADTELARRNLLSVQLCYDNVAIYNQSVAAALERLTRDLSMNVRLLRSV